jgi:hypothetical protein
MDSAQLAEWFAYHPPSDPMVMRAHEEVRTRAHQLAAWFNWLLPEGREKSQALTALDLAAMHANAAIARTQTVNAEALDATDDAVDASTVNVEAGRG